MPLHVWLPRAHPIAPAPVSALMSGVMIKVALYGLVRVLVEWVGVLPVWFGVLVLAVGALSAVGGVVYALFQHDLKRLLALHSIENVGIIVLGLGACLVLRARGADSWAAFALGAALLHTVNHAVFKALLFLGAGAFERAVGSLELDRLGGLLRRMPWTGGAFLVGAMAIAGLPPLNGFASEWLTLQALLHVTAYGHVGDGIAGAVALAALAATAALALFCFVKVVGLVLLGPPRSDAAAAAEEAPLPMRAALVLPRRASASCSASRPACSSARSSGSRPGRPACRPQTGLDLPGTGSLPTVWIAVVLVGAHRRLDAPAREPSAPRRRRPGRPASASSPRFTGRAPASPSRCASCSSSCSARSGRSPCGAEGGVLQEVAYTGHVPAADRRSRLRAARACLARRRRPRSAPAERKPRHLRRLPRRRSSSCSSPPRVWGGSDELARQPSPGRFRSSGASLSHRSCRASSSTGRRVSREGGGRLRCSPTVSCGGCGERAPSLLKERASSTGSHPQSSAQPSWQLFSSCRLRRLLRAGASATTRSCSWGCSRWRGSRSLPPPGTWVAASR